MLLLPLAAACGGASVGGAQGVASVVHEAAAAVRGDVVRSGRLSSFSSVELDAPVDMSYTTTAGEARYEMRGSAALAERITVGVENGRLCVRLKGKQWNPRRGEHLTITVSGPALSAVTLSSTGSLRADAITALADARVELGGTGSLRVGKVKAGGALQAVLDGTGDLSMGRVDVDGRAEFSLDGTGNVRTDEVRAGAGSLWQLSGTGEMRAGGIAGGPCSVTLDGTGSMAIDALTVREARLALDGTGSLAALGIDVERLDVEQTGMGSTLLKGRTGSLTLKADGHGGVEAQALTAGRVDVRAGGFSHVACHATEALTVDARDHAQVRYKGHPSVTDRSERRKEYLQHID